MKKLLLLALSMTLVALLAAACAQPAPAPAPAPTPAPTPAPSPAPAPAPGPAAKATVWKLATVTGAVPPVWTFNPYPRFQSMVDERTGGQLKMDTLVGLVPDADVLAAVIDGRADIGLQWTPYVSGTFPLWDFGSLPFFWANPYEYEKAINDPRMVAILDKSYRGAGVVKLFDAVAGPLDAIWGNKMVKTVDDFKGLKIRTSGLLPTFTLQLLGAAPLTISAPELADALKRGTVDAVLTSVSYGAGVGMMDVTKYISYWPIQSFYGVSIVANLKSWNALPADVQQGVRTAAREMQMQNIFASDAVYYKIAKLIIKAAMQTVDPDATELNKARELSKPAIDKWLGVTGPLGKDILAICGDYASGAKIMLKK